MATKKKRKKVKKKKKVARRAVKKKVSKKKKAKKAKKKKSSGKPSSKKQAITFEMLVAMSNDEREQVMQTGHPIDLNSITGYEFLGLNVGVPKPFMKLFQKFTKAFYLDPDTGQLRGWNLKAMQDGPDRPWTYVARQPGGPAFGPIGRVIEWVSGVRADHPAHGFYTAYPANEDRKFNKIPQALLVNYAQGRNGFLNVTSRLKDYIVAVNEGDDTLLLGMGVFDMGLFSLPGEGHFILRKHRKIHQAYDPPRAQN